jgi:3',5'-cyclic AMP phosphodiesterase CpdA
MLGRIRHHAPDVVVHLGDGHEASAASKFEDEEKTELKEDFAEHNQFLETVRTTAELAADGKPVQCVFLPGNHDDNILAMGRIDKHIRSCCDYREHEPELKEKRWEMPAKYVYDRKLGTFSIGQVTFAHGYEAGQSSDEFQSILLSQYTHSLFVSGHTHRPVHVTRSLRTKAVPLPYWYANAGCLRDLKPGYVARKRTHLWGQAIVAGEAQLISSPRTTRQWDAQTEIFRMSDDL